MKALTLTTAWILIAASIATGCSTLSSLGLDGGAGGQVVVRTTPPSANVYFIDVKTGQTALIGKSPVTFSRKDHAQKESEVIQLRIEKEGYEPRYSAVTAFGRETTYIDMALTQPMLAKGEVREAFEQSRRLMDEVNRLLLGKRFSEALATVEKVIQLDPKNAEAHAAKGSVLYLMKDFDGANSAWTQALLINPAMDSVRENLIELSHERVRREPASTGRN